MSDTGTYYSYPVSQPAPVDNNNRYVAATYTNSIADLQSNDAELTVAHLDTAEGNPGAVTDNRGDSWFLMGGDPIPTDDTNRQVWLEISASGLTNMEQIYWFDASGTTLATAGAVQFIAPQIGTEDPWWYEMQWVVQTSETLREGDPSFPGKYAQIAQLYRQNKLAVRFFNWDPILPGTTWDITYMRLVWGPAEIVPEVITPQLAGEIGEVYVNMTLDG